MLRVALILSVVFLLCRISPPSFAQVPQGTSGSITEAERIARQIELKETERQVLEGAEARRKFEAELSAIRSDRAQLIQKTIDLAASVKTLEARISGTEERLSKALGEEERIDKSLQERQAVILDLLSGLHRIGHMPPPLLLADPDDLLSTIRGAMLLGAALPELTDEARRLSADLQARQAAREAVETERKTIEADIAKLVSERQQLALALDARQRDQLRTEEKVADEAARVAALAAKSQTLKDLLGHAEADIADVQKATEAAKSAPAAADVDANNPDAQGGRSERSKLMQEAFSDPNRMAPKVAFSELKGLLRQIVAGSVIRGFNDKDTVGNPVKGLSVITRPDAVILSPADVWVSFAGPFRSFGQLLILNAGGGYYILLAGMDRMTVGLGQFVLAGEPIGVMPGPSATGADETGPSLYIEFRKDGTPIDPVPWWAPGMFEKVRE